MGKIANFDEVRSLLKTHLAEYLTEKGFDVNGNINCINPNHEDHNPSMGLVPASENTVLFCFGCHQSYDIIDTYAILEGTPTEGAGWLVSTFLPLCRKYGINPEMEEMSEEDKHRYSVFRAYERAAQVVKHSDPTTLLLAETDKRGWNVFQAKDLFGIGSISFNEFIAKMAAYGYTKSFLEQADLYNKQIFNDSGLIIPIRDDTGLVAGFVTRNLKSSNRKNKFYNTSNKCPVYNKSKILFNFDRAKKAVPPLIITESYMDTITMVLNGIENVVGIGSTSLTDEHVELLREYEINDIVLALDFDEAGQAATEKYITDLSGQTGLSVKVIVLPEEHKSPDIIDPEDLIRIKGVDIFHELPRVTAFEWKLLNSDFRANSYELAIKTVPVIANEASPIERERMCKILANHTGLAIDVLKEELDRILNIESNKRSQQREAILQNIVKQLQKYPLEAYTVLTKGIEQLDTLVSDDSAYKISNTEFVEFLDVKRQSDEEILQLNYKSGFPEFDRRTFSRWAEPGQLIALGGKPNSGKTALLVNLAYNIAEHNEDAHVLFHTVDDSRFIVIPKFVAMLSGIWINHIVTPQQSKQFWTSRNLIHEREAAYLKLSRLAEKDKLIVKDSEYGTTFESIERWLKHYRKLYKEDKLFYFLDNFYLLTDFASMEERVRMKTLSRMIKNLAVKYGVSIFMTVEYTKMEVGSRPTNTNILETGQIEYDCTGIYHLHNPFGECGENLPNTDDWVWCADNEITGETMQRPKVELITGKSKLSAYKGSYRLRFTPELSKFEEDSYNARIVL